MKKRGKRSLAFLIALSMIVSSLQIYVDADNVQAAETSYEYDVDVSIAEITASSSKDGHGPELVDDGIYYDDENNWIPASKPTADNPQWLLLDFGEVTEVGFVEAGVTDGKGPKSYEIQVSEDGKSFKTVFSNTPETSRAIVAEFDTTSARYMKLVITDSYADDCAINEVTVFEDILPHRVGVLAGVGDLGDFGEAGFESLREEGMELVNLCVQICDPNHLEHSILPGLADKEVFPNGIGIDEVLDYVSNPDNYVWEGADGYFDNFISRGFDIWLGFQGFNKATLGCLYSDIIDESGRSVEHRDFFNETHNKVVIEIAKQTMAHYDNNPHIRCYSILGPGWFGGIEFYSGSNPELLAVYSDAAQNYFREWLADKYETIDALNAAWGTSYGDFASVVVPKPIRDNENAVDDRPEWVDLMVWKMEYMDNFVNEYMTEIRSVTDKVIHAEIDGGYQSAPMETGESMGKMVRDFTQYNNVIVANSNLDSSFGVAQFTSTADFYGAENGNTMDDTGQLDEFKHVDNAFNFLAYGAGTLAHCHIGNDFAAWNGSVWDTEGDYSGTAMYEWTKTNANKFSLMDPEGSDSDVVIFNPWYSNLFSQDYLTRDYEYVFDAEHGVVWLGAGYANWSHYLDSPNMYDDFPIEDGALTSEGKKVLIVANKDVVLTSAAAEEEILSWINEGGAFVGFGKDCFNYTFDADANAVVGGDEVEYWMMGLSGGTAVTEMVGTTVKVSEDAPEWVKSLEIGQTASYVNSDTTQMVAFSAVEDGVTPVLEDEAGNIIMCEKQVGEGSVLFCTLPIANSAMFKDEFMSTLLGDYADSRNIERTVTYDPEKYHVVDAGIDQNTGKRVIEVSRNDGTTDDDILVIGHDSSLDGVEAIIDLNWKTDSVIYHTFEEGKPFVYGDSIYGEIAGSADIKVNEDGTSEVIVDMGYAYELVSIELNAENKITNIAFAENSAGDAWTVTGDAFDGSLTELSDGNNYILSDSESGSIGKIVSDSFTIEDNMLSFYSIGYAGEKTSSESVPDEEPEVEEPETLEDIVIVDFAEGDWSDLEAVNEEVYGSAPVTGNKNWANESGFWDGYYAHSGAVNEALSGTLRSKDFVVERETLSFLEAGYCGIVYGTGSWPDYATGGNVFRLVDAETDEVLIEEQPINVFGWDEVNGTKFGDFREHTFDVSEYAGRTVYFEMSDGIEGGYGWFAFTNLKQTGEEVEAVEPLEDIVLVDFAEGDWSDLEAVNEEVYGSAPVTGYANWANESGFWDGYYAHSGAVSETLSGTLRSKDFVVERETLSFLEAGYCGIVYGAGNWPDYATGGNVFRLVDAETGEVLIEEQPINVFGREEIDGTKFGDFREHTFDISEYAGRTVYFEMSDGIEGGYGWFAFTNLKQTGKEVEAKDSEEESKDIVVEDFASGDWSGLSEVDNNFGSAPKSNTSTWSGYYAASNTDGGDAATGILRTETFTIERKELSFLELGYCGPVYGPGAWVDYPNGGGNVFRLVDAETGEVLIEEQPINTFGTEYGFEDFREHVFDVSAYEGKEVYFEMEDSITTGFGWFAFTNLRQTGDTFEEKETGTVDKGYTSVADFESGTWDECVSVDELFGTAPSTSGVTGASGSYACSAAVKESMTGSLKTKTFVIDRPTLTFDGAGWNGQFWEYNTDHGWYLKDAATDEVLIWTAPENRGSNSANFKTYTWDVTEYEGREVYFEMIDALDASGFAWLAVDNVMLVGDKFNAEVVATGYNAYYLKNVKGEILKAAYPKNSEEAALISWDVSDLIGEEVHFEAIDGMNNAENGWFGFGELFSYNYTDAIEDDYWSFESGTYDGWETTGDAFAGVANSDKLGRPLGDDNGKYWADSFANGETATGTLTSMEFEIEKPFISFYTSGWNREGGGLPYENYYELIDAEGNQLRVTTPLRSDPLNTMVRQYWDVSDLIGETVRFRVVDGLAATGYAWIVVDSIRQEYNFNFENGYNGWVVNGEAFGTEPITSSIVLNQRDSAWADSYLAGSSLTGTLTSDFFTMDGDTINFLSAGYSDGGQNYYRLLNETGEEIAKAAPTDEEWFSMISMTAAGYAGKKVQLQVVDGSTSAAKGWIAIDDLNFRMATDDGSSSSVFPEQIDIAISMDGENWTESASLAMAGKTKETVDMAGSCARYVRFILSTDKVDSAFLNYVKINKKVTTVAEDVAAEDGIIDFGSVQTFNSLVADFANNEVREMTISVSEDGATWNTVYTAFEAENNPLEVYFTEVSARYVKFEGDVEDLESVSVYLISTPSGVEDMMPVPGAGSGDDSGDSGDDSGNTGDDSGNTGDDSGNTGGGSGSIGGVGDDISGGSGNNPFKDVSEDSIFYDAILWAYENEITKGRTATTFEPLADCTRGQVVTFLWRAEGCPEPTITKNPFTDVDPASPYYKAILWAYENGITTGKTATTFQPGVTVTREQFVTFLWRNEGKPASTVKNPFVDVVKDRYSTPAILWAYENGITTGKTLTTFQPAASVIRQHVVTFLYRAYN